MSIVRHNPRSREEGDIPGGVYVVGLFDLLGQSNALTPYYDVRADPEYIDKLTGELARITSQLSAFRSDMREYFDAASAAKLTDEPPVGVTAEQIAIAADFQSPKIKLQGFSDTVVAYVPLSTPTGQLSLYGIWALMISVANTMLLSFARGFALRGAIDVSWGAEPFQGEFYGPALLSAHTLESKVANWSRVVLGPGINRLWDSTSTGNAQTPIESVNKALAQIQASWAFRDVDGTMAVDYLGSAMHDVLATSGVDLAPVIDVAHVGLEKLLRDAIGSIRPRTILSGAAKYFESRVGPLNELRRARAALMRRGESGNHADTSR